MSEHPETFADRIPDGLAEAKRRWGDNGHVFLRESCLVGIAIGHDLRVYGQGNTWEEAFADADRNGRAIRVYKAWPVGQWQ